MQRKFELHQFVAPGFTLNQHTDICNICLDLKVNPIKCTTCKAEFCKYCAERWRKSGKRCPNRCCVQWEYQQITGLEIKLKCPFECQILVTPNQFIDHYKKCSKGPIRVSEEILKQNYHCSYNHPLKYLDNPKDVPTNIECALCQVQKSICRSSCIQCKNLGEQFYRYCCQCRFPKNMTKTCCPAGHNNFYIRGPSKNKNVICDLCSIKIYPNCCIQDPECDVAICATCYEKLQNGPGVALDLADYEDSQQDQQIVNTQMQGFFNMVFQTNLANLDNEQLSQYDFNVGQQLLMSEISSSVMQQQPNQNGI